MDILIKASQLILSLSILVVLHELGHFIPAKLFRIKVEKFYLFFNPWFSLFKIKKGETEYGIGWLPLGGYVKIAGMIDESMDKEQMQQEPQPWEFRSKPAWQRLIIMLGGVTVNIILGIFLYAMILFVWGDTFLPNKNLKDGIWVVDSMATNMGFQTGDKILSINDKELYRFDEVMGEMLYAKKVQVDRGGQIQTLDIPENFIGQLVDNKTKQIIHVRIPAMVASVPDTSAAKTAGLQEKDKVVAINGTPIKYFDQLKDSLLLHKNEKVVLTVEREGGVKDLTLSVNGEGKVGFVPALFKQEEMIKMKLYDFEVQRYGFFEAIPGGFNKAWEKITFYVRQFALIFNPSTGAYKGVGGFATIGNIFPAEWDWEIFFNITAFLSIILAFMNVLPIPALDGGHALFTLYEMITGRKPPEKFLEYAQIVGMALLFSLLIYANGNDLFRWISDKF